MHSETFRRHVDVCLFVCVFACLSYTSHFHYTYSMHSLRGGGGAHKKGGSGGRREGGKPGATEETVF